MSDHYPTVNANDRVRIMQTTDMERAGLGGKWATVKACKGPQGTSFRNCLLQVDGTEDEIERIWINVCHLSKI